MSGLSRVLLLAALASAAGLYLLWAWYQPSVLRDAESYHEAGSVTPPAQTEALAVKAVRVVPKAKAKKLRLPASIEADERQQVLTAVTVPPSPGGATAVTVLDTATGSARTLVREKPRPLLALERGTEAGLRYGVSSEGATLLNPYLRRDLARVGNLHLALYADATLPLGPTDRPTEARAMVDLSLRW